MKIQSIRVYRRDLALSKPYTIAYETIGVVENVFVEIVLDGGIIGTGAANPAPEVVGEGISETLQNLQSPAIQLLIGQDIRLFRSLIDQVSAAFPQQPGTLAAIDIALHDAFGQWLGIPLAAFYGQYHTALPTSVTIGIMDVPDTLAEAKAYAELGFKVLKIKTGQDVNQDIERIRKLHENWGQALRLRVDANQGYGLPDLEKFLNATHHCGLELIEQPLAVGGEPQLLALDTPTRQRFCADESLRDARTAVQLAQWHQPFGIFNIKLMKCGGIKEALAIANIAQQADIQLFWGCNDESIVSITAALHAAFACPNTRFLDLDGSLDLAEDIVTSGFTLHDGLMRLSAGAGLGLMR
jgi:L-alanine-DL-glutamate epimerase-like enolase superfamily enzyme